MHEPCPSQPYDRDAILDSVSRWTSEPAALLDLLAQVGGYGHLCARGPGVECDADGERAARIARASARIEHGDIRRPRVRDCDPS